MFCKLVLPSNEIHKLCSLPNSFEELRQVIGNKLKGKVPQDFVLKYKDTDDELITLSSDEDLETAILTANSENLKTLRIFILPNVEHVSTVKHDLNLNPLPRIPETLEKSKSSLDEISIPGASKQNSQPPLNNSQFSPPDAFDIRKLPKTHSMIIDEVETVHSLTPFSEKPAEPFMNRKIFTFSKQDTMEYPHNQYDPSKIDSFLTQDQIQLINNLVDKKIEEGLFDKIQTLTQDLVARLNDELALPTPSPGRMSPYQSGLIKGINRGPRRHTMVMGKGFSQQEHALCFGCETEITGIRYNCLTCSNFVCCETCETQLNHPHPLLKIRPATINNPNMGLPGSSNPSPYVVRTPVRHSTVGIGAGLVSLGSDNNLNTFSSHVANLANLANLIGANPSPITPTGANRAGPLRRGMSMGTIMGQMSNKTAGECESKYKATIGKSSIYDLINVRPNHSYNVQLTIKNSGDNKWSNRIKLVCINGIYKGNETDIVALQPGEEQMINLTLLAPIQGGKYLSQWKLHDYEEEPARPFGKAIYIEIEVSERDKHGHEEPTKGMEEIEEEEETPVKTPDIKDKTPRGVLTEINVAEPDNRLMRELKCSEQVLNRAKMLNDMFPGEIKEKVDFISRFAPNMNINDTVSAYLGRLSNTSKARPSWSNNQRISTQS